MFLQKLFHRPTLVTTLLEQQEALAELERARLAAGEQSCSLLRASVHSLTASYRPAEAEAEFDALLANVQAFNRIGLVTPGSGSPDSLTSA